jgi:hypothetical protein
MNERRKTVTDQTSFSGKCPKCGGYNSRVRSELINYGSALPSTR